MSGQTCGFCHGNVVDDFCEDCGKSASKVPLVTAATGGFGDDLAGSAPATGRTTSTRKFTVSYPTRSTTVGTKAKRRRTDLSTPSSTRRTALGGGLISLPELPSNDPLKLLMAVAEVPAAKRRCSGCDTALNRSKGFCPSCGTKYDFEPHLKAGDVVCGKYEIKGPIAFGGLGWIYLGWDQVLSRWVILKGLLNTDDEAAAAAAVAERRYLAAVKHPKIVGIYDFVSQGTEGFIIMEYVGGEMVQSIRKAKGAPLPPEEAIAYILGILPAFAYLHAQGMVYCDFKPDNVMVEGTDVKLIDMGAVRRIGDPDGDIYATVGFSAPEADRDPVAVSDLYTIGRTLAVLIMDFKFTSTFEYSLPSPDDIPVLAENESLYRFLLRATHVEPDERFQSADEMADQLFGVLREMVALKAGPKPADSRVFTGDRIRASDIEAMLTAALPLSLPSLRLNTEDRSANELIRVMALIDPVAQVEELGRLVTRYKDRSIEPMLRLAEVLIANPDLVGTSSVQSALGPGDLLKQSEDFDAFDWRTQWLRGLYLAMQKKGAEARACFEKVYFEMPGELAPRLAMGFAAEMAGDFEQALPYYDRVGRVDPAYITAHFGAARCHSRLGALKEAVDALDRVPETHALYGPTHLAIAELLLMYPDKLNVGLFKRAEAAMKSALPQGGQAYQVCARLFEQALALSPTLGWPTQQRFLEQSFDEVGLRVAAEQNYRRAARGATSTLERYNWIAHANRVRPLTLV